jgi:hypothetical protein
MAIPNFFLWWYTNGWAFFIRQSIEKCIHINEYFSIPDLLKTLFRPFRQISANERGKGLEGALHVFLDQTISRFVGMLARTFIIIAGLIAFFLSLAVTVITAILWPLLPIAPIIGLVLSVIGVML